MAPFQPQYNRPNYPNRNYSPKKNYNQSSGSRGSAKLINTKKDGCILTVETNDQNLVLKGYWSSKGVGLDGVVVGSYILITIKLNPNLTLINLDKMFNKTQWTVQCQ